MTLVARYASLVKFSHTLFAMPFALVAYGYALWSTPAPFDGWLLVKVLLAMVFARNAAMGLNRYADRRIDALNPRTAAREIPAGVIPARHALWFVWGNAALFVGVAFLINTLAGLLSPVALGILLGYSYTKRYTAWCHIVLGTALAIAPVGAHIAVTGTVAVFPLVLAGLVVTWVAGFDILYALQDIEFDRRHGLHSIPARWGVRRSIGISIALHICSAFSVWVVGAAYGGGMLYGVGALFFVGMLAGQHLIATPRRFDRIGPVFGLVNGLSSVGYATFTLLDLWRHFS